MAMKQKRQKRTPPRLPVGRQERGLKNLRPQASLRCRYCGCETDEGVIKAAHWTERRLIVIEDIPARLCQGCGEQFFEEEVIQKIQKALTYPTTKAKRQIRVPVYSLEAVIANQDHREIFLCKYCESATVEELVKSVLWVDGGLIAVENIPARVCQRCGEQFYDDQTAEELTALGKRRFEPPTAKRKVLVSVFSAADVVKESLSKTP
jgi:YgiT-type zinc finger domain-containing protein